jgi:biotin-(acetyl-CoA carboxylase) ligase
MGMRVKSSIGPNLPPPFRAVALREAGDALVHAVRIAETEGAGTFVHVGRFDLAEFAVVLEPEYPLRSARRVIYAGLVAIADALAAGAPPEKPIVFTWPDCIYVDRGLVGGARLAWPTGAHEDMPPPWLVFGGMIRTAGGDDEMSGLALSSTSLAAEGFETGAVPFFERFTRHFMAMLDSWQQEGFSDIARRYLLRLSPAASVPQSIDENGDLLSGAVVGAQKRGSLTEALRQVSWLDGSTGSPRW